MGTTNNQWGLLVSNGGLAQLITNDNQWGLLCNQWVLANNQWGLVNNQWGLPLMNVRL